MPVYWSMLIVTSLISIYSLEVKKKNIEQYNKNQFKYSLISFAYIVFFCGMRDKVLDTGTYIAMYKSIPTEFANMVHWAINMDTGKGFYLMTGIFKIIMPDSHYIWLTAISGLSCAMLLRTYNKYSDNMPFVIYLFLATATFTWLINGMRQFLAATILFGFADLIVDGEKNSKMKYILLVLLMYTIHSSAIFFLPITVIVSSKKIWDKKMVLFVVMAVIGTYFSDSVFSVLNSSMDKDYTASLESGGGSSYMRLLIALIPIIMVIFTKKSIEKKATPEIKVAINMSLISACFYFASTFTNGILVGRMPIYFNIYNLYLLPWIIKNCFEKRTGMIITIICIVMYLAYFYYQMEIAWHGLGYVSDILNLNYK